MSNISEDLDRDYAPGWKPAAGDKLIGEIVELGQRADYNGDPYPIVTVRTTDQNSQTDGQPVDAGTELAFHAFHTVPRQEINQNNPQPGDKFGVKYLGQVPTTNGRGRYHNYKVRMQLANPSTKPTPVDPEPVDAGHEFGDDAPF